MSETLVGVIIGGLLVTASGLVVEIIRARGAFGLDKEKRADDRRLSRDNFQRETLLALQEAVHSSARAAGLVHTHDLQASRQGTPWGSTLMSEDRAEADRIGRLTLGMLRSRVADDGLREQIGEFMEASSAVGWARDATAGDEALLRTMKLAAAVTERSGELIRRSFRAD